MKLQFPKPIHYFPRQLIRRAGYGEISNREGETSYVRVMGIGGYPRWHAYLEDIEGGFTLNLHLDQKRAVYEGQTAHSGEYDGDQVIAEAARIVSIFKPLLN